MTCWPPSANPILQCSWFLRMTGLLVAADDSMLPVITKRIVSKVPGNELRDSRTALAALWIQSVELNRRGSIGYGDSIEGMNLGVGLRGVGVSREYGLRLDRDP